MKQLVIWLFAFCLSAGSPAPQHDTLTKKFLGAWRLVSIEGELPGRPGIFDRPTGQLIYDASGRMSTQIATKANRTFSNSFATATAEEKAAAFNTYIAVFGTYEIDAKAQTITHHVEASLGGLHGVDLVRWFEFQGDDRLLLIPVEDGKGGTINRKDATFKLLWERIK